LISKNNRLEQADPSANMTDALQADSLRLDQVQAAQAMRDHAKKIALENATMSLENLKALSPEEIRQTLYELSVHQIELEMQNHELHRVHTEMDIVRARYFDLYDLAPVGYCILSEHGLILEANLTTATLLGVVRSELIMQPISLFILEEDENTYYLHRKQLFETKEPQELDMQMVKKDRTAFWAHLKSTLALDAAGEPVCRIVMSDITKSRRTDTSLRESEQNFRTLADSGHALIWTSGTDKLCNYFNRVWLEFTGRKLEQEMGNGWTEGVHPDDLQRCLDIYVVAFGRREKFSMEYRLLRYDGEYRWILDDGCPRYDSRGEFIGYIGHCLDISERKHNEEALRESEENFRSIFENNSIAIAIIDADSTISMVNEEYCRVSGYTKHEVIGMSWMQHIPPEDLERIKEFNRRRLINPEDAPYKYETTFYHKNGEIKHALMSVAMLNKRKIITSFIDITELKRTEKENAKLEVQLRHAQKMESIGFLAGGIAHDLNNILFPISGLSEMLLDDIPPGSPDHKSIEQIYKSVQRGSDLVKQILSFSRQSKPQKLPIKIQSILREVLKLVRSAIPMNIEITSHIKPDCGMVSADPTQVHQIAMNLITNAYHAVERNGGTIDIELKETGPTDGTSEYPIQLLAGEYACITVSDTGTGIDKTLIDKIFDPYFTTKELGKGTGLGLSVVYGIVKEHGGDIQVYSEVGKGTAFHVYLPLLKDANDMNFAAVTREYPTGRERILLVDDEEPIVRMEQIMLERLGYQVTARTSSPDALAAFKANPGHFDLVISDRGMPNMTGEQLARELILIKPGIPIIICTGFSDENDVNRAKAMGIKGFLMKPVATGDLATMVRKVLDDVADSVQVHESGQ